jgi:hypothetical protein
MGWAGLDWAGLGWTGLDWVGSDGLGRDGRGCAALRKVDVGKGSKVVCYTMEQ